MLRSLLVIMTLVSAAALCFVVGCSDSKNPTGSGGGTPPAGEGWTLIAPYPTASTIIDVDFMNDSMVIIHVEPDSLFRSTDAGQTWHFHSTVPMLVFDIEFIDEHNGWIVGMNGYIGRTTDGGLTWQQQDSRTDTALNELLFFDDAGWIIGSTGPSIVNLRSIDGGAAWLPASFPNIDGLTSIWMEGSEGWAVARADTGQQPPLLLRTDNGGDTWSQVETGIPVTSFGRVTADGEGNIAVIAFHTEGSTTQSLRILSFDDGVTWESQVSPVAYQSFGFVGESVIWGTGPQGFVEVSFDAGRSWNELATGLSQTIYAMDFAGAETGCMVGPHGIIFNTSDSGQSVELLTTGYLRDLGSVWFTGEKQGWATSRTAGLLRTVDGGITWKRTQSTAGQALHFISDRVGWAAGYDGSLDFTSDGGESWHTISSSLGDALTDIYFVDALHGWAIGNNRVLNTTDGGHTWSTQFDSSGQYQDITLHDVQFINQNVGWVSGHAIVLRTENGGLSWDVVTPDSNDSNFISIHFRDRLNGFVLTGQDLWQTIDGGGNWSVALHSDKALADLTFADDDYGWIVGAFEGAFATTDGGQSWVEQPTPYPTPVYRGSFCSAFALDDRRVWVVGNRGTVARTTSGGW